MKKNKQLSLDELKMKVQDVILALAKEFPHFDTEKKISENFIRRFRREI